MKPLLRLAPAAGLALLVGLLGCDDEGTSPSATLTATCSASPVSGLAPLAVAFSLNLAGSPFFDVSFNFGDGTRSVEGFFTSSKSLHLPHVYQAPGGYTASFSASGAEGQSATCLVGVSVTEPSPAAFRFAPLLPSANGARNVLGSRRTP
jgi:PKD repeat protein